MQAIQATQATQATQIGYHVPVMPTEESQADKGINHPIVSCWDCDAEWRSYKPSRCPGCARHVGAPRVLNEQETHELMQAISQLEEEAKFDCINGYDSWEFDSSLNQYASRWFSIDSRRIIQACYFALLKQDTNPKVAFAIEFFKAEYEFAE
jgi:hypothetical protein